MIINIEYYYRTSSKCAENLIIAIFVGGVRYGAPARAMPRGPSGSAIKVMNSGMPIVPLKRERRRRWKRRRINSATRIYKFG